MKSFTRFSRRFFLRALVVSAVLALTFGSDVRAEVIAFWRFESAGSFLTDSSGNGHTLANGAGGLAATPSGDVGTGGGSGSALFDGGDVMNTLASLDLTPYRHLKISWMQKQTALGGVKVLFEHTTNYNNTDGAFLATVNSDLGGSNPATQGYFILNAVGANNSDLYTQSPNNWISMVADINLDSTGGAIVRLFDGNNNPIGTDRDTGSSPSGFINDTLFIGARGPTASIGFVGNIDELKIESIPEPSTWVLLTLGLPVLLRLRLRAAR